LNLWSFRLSLERAAERLYRNHKGAYFASGTIGGKQIKHLSERMAWGGAARPFTI